MSKKHGFREISRSDSSPSEIPSVHLSDGLPRTRRSGKQYENAYGLFGIRRRWIAEMDKNTLDGAVLGALVTYKTGR